MKSSVFTFGLLTPSLVSLAYASPVTYAEPQPRPLVLWHGLGDSHSSAVMLEFASMIKGIHPGIFVHSIYIDEDLSADQKAGFVRALYWLAQSHT